MKKAGVVVGIGVVCFRPEAGWQRQLCWGWEHGSAPSQTNLVGVWRVVTSGMVNCFGLRLDGCGLSSGCLRALSLLSQSQLCCGCVHGSTPFHVVVRIVGGEGGSSAPSVMKLFRRMEGCADGCSSCFATGLIKNNSGRSCSSWNVKSSEYSGGWRILDGYSIPSGRVPIGGGIKWRGGGSTAGFRPEEGNLMSIWRLNEAVAISGSDWPLGQIIRPKIRRWWSAGSAARQEACVTSKANSNRLHLPIGSMAWNKEKSFKVGYLNLTQIYSN